MKHPAILIFMLVGVQLYGQQLKKGQLTDYFLDIPVVNAKISIVDSTHFVLSDSLGHFEITLFESDYILIEAQGYRKLKVKASENTSFGLHLVRLKPPPESERFYSVVDEHASLVTGETILEHILNSFQHWDRVNKEGIKGRAEIELKLDEYGKILDSRLIKGITKYVDEEILRIVNASQWRPSILENRNVKTRMRFIVSF
jgi:hypothetical protein